MATSPQKKFFFRGCSFGPDGGCVLIDCLHLPYLLLRGKSSKKIQKRKHSPPPPNVFPLTPTPSLCHISPLLLFLGEGNPFCTFVLSSSHAFLYMGLGGQTALNTSPTKKEKKKERKRCLSLLFLSFSLPLSHKAWRQEWNGFHQSLNISKHKNLHNFGESFLYRLFLFRCSFVTDFSSRC